MVPDIRDRACRLCLGLAICASDVYPFEVAQIEAQVGEAGAKVLRVQLATCSNDSARLRVMTRATESL